MPESQLTDLEEIEIRADLHTLQADLYRIEIANPIPGLQPLQEEYAECTRQEIRRLERLLADG